MRTAWAEGDERREVVSPLSLIVLGVRAVRRRARNADAAAADRLRADRAGAGGPRARPGAPRRLGARAGLRPGRQRDAGRRRSGGHPRPLRGACGSCGRRAACSPTTIGRTAACSSRSARWRSPGAPASRSTPRPSPAQAGRARPDAALMAGLFAEELGAVVQVREDDAAAVMEAFARHGVAARVVARPEAGERIAITRGAQVVYERSRVDLHRAWSETTWQMQSMRDNPACAQQEYDRILDRDDPGLSVRLTFDPADDVAAPFVARGARPADRDPARPGRERRGRDGGRLRPRRVRRARRAHERRHRRARVALRLPRALRRAAASRSATCSAAARAGPSRRSTTRGRATSSPPSSRGPTRSRSASATAAR